MSNIVGDKVKVQWVLTVKENTFNQRHNIARRVILGTNNRNVYHLHKTVSSRFKITYGNYKST